MTCKCGSNIIISINAKCGDMCSASLSENGEHLEREGYAPHIESVCGGDYIEFKFCASCGLIQNFCSLTEKQARYAIKGDEDEEQVRGLIDRFDPYGKHGYLDHDGYFKKRG